MQVDTEAFAPAGAERFRQGRHESEYFDPTRPVEKTAADANWAVESARRAIDAVERASQRGDGSPSFIGMGTNGRPAIVS